MPSGYKEAFTFNLIVNGYSIKTGKFVLNIPAEYQKPGRRFALLGLNRAGKALRFVDIDSIEVKSGKDYMINYHLHKSLKCVNRIIW